MCQEEWGCLLAALGGQCRSQREMATQDVQAEGTRDSLAEESQTPRTADSSEAEVQMGSHSLQPLLALNETRDLTGPGVGEN
jgi:hypothetical protein